MGAGPPLGLEMQPAAFLRRRRCIARHNRIDERVQLALHRPDVIIEVRHAGDRVTTRHAWLAGGRISAALDLWRVLRVHQKARGDRCFQRLRS